MCMGDIYVYNIEDENTINISEGMMGYDMAPVYSPDGSMIAWESMERDGYESDQTRLIIYDIESGSWKDHSADFDQNTGGYAWNGNEGIYFISPHLGSYEIFYYDLGSGSFRQVTEGIHNYRSVAMANDKLIASRQSMSMSEACRMHSQDFQFVESISMSTAPVITSGSTL